MPDGAEADPDRTTRSRLLDAAAEVFAERGYDRAGVQEIARAAGLTTGAIYANFRDKAELLLEVIGDIVASQDASLVQLQEHPEEAAGARSRFLDDIGAWIAPDRERFRGLLLEAHAAGRRDPRVREVLEELGSARHTGTRAVIRRLQKEGVIATDVDPEALATLMFAIPLGVCLLEAAGLPLPKQEPWVRLIERLLDALTEPPGPGSGGRRSRG